MDQDAKREEAFRMSLAETKGFNLGKENGFKLGKEGGFKLGKEDGQRTNQLDNARRMKADGMDPLLIAKYTGLSESDVLKL